VAARITLLYLPHQLLVALYIADLTGRWLWSQPSTVTPDSLPLAI
jgi:hypothetical protein